MYHNIYLDSRKYSNLYDMFPIYYIPLLVTHSSLVSSCFSVTFI